MRLACVRAQLSHAAAYSNAAQRRASAHRSAAPRPPRHWCPSLHPAAHLRSHRPQPCAVTVRTSPPTPLARITRGEPRESGPDPTLREFKGWRHPSPMNPTYKSPARPSRTAPVGARSNTRAREFKVRRGRAHHGGTAKTQPAAHPRKQRSQTQTQRAPSHSIRTCHNLLA